MSDISAADFLEMNPAHVRLQETRQLFEHFKSARNAKPNCGLFLLTTYFDALLFCLVSIEEMVSVRTQRILRSLDSFLFFKALRNITAHHIVLSGIKGKFERPIARVVYVGIGCAPEFSEQFYVISERLEAILDAVLAERPGERGTIEGARSGECQDSCRLVHAADRCLLTGCVRAGTASSRSGFKVTTVMGDQSRVVPDQRRGFCSRALR